MPTLQDLFGEMKKAGTLSEVIVQAVENMVSDAAKAGFIDERMVAILKHRVPLPSSPRLEPAQIGQRLGISSYLVIELGALAYGAMIHYVQDRSDPGKIEVLKLNLDQLPWPDGYAGTAAINAISNYFRTAYDYERRPTAIETLVVFEILASQGRRFAARQYGSACLAATHRTFTAARIPLPSIRIKNGT